MNATKRAKLDQLEKESDQLVGVAEIAAYLRRDVKTVEQLILSGELTVHKIAGRRQTYVDEVRRFVRGGCEHAAE